MATEEILRAIPHRQPFLFIDEIVSQDETSLVARRVLRSDESFFQGHYPGNPIMPGVLMSEAVLQAGAVFLSTMLAAEIEADPDMVPVIARITDARFKSIARPGDELIITVTYKEKMGRFLFMDGDVKNAAGNRVMNISFCVALAKASQA